MRPPVELVAQYGWVAYMIAVCFPVAGWLGALNKAISVAFGAIGLAKLALKLAASWTASFSFALGRNAQLVAGYMEQRQQQLVVGAGDGSGSSVEPVPRYIVMREAKKHVEESSKGCRVRRDALEEDLVTLDRVWRMAAFRVWSAVLDHICSVPHRPRSRRRRMVLRRQARGGHRAVLRHRFLPAVGGCAGRGLGGRVRRLLQLDHDGPARPLHPARSSCTHAALGSVLRLTPARRWRDKVGQNLVLEPDRFRVRRAGLLLSEQLYGRAGIMKLLRSTPSVPIYLSF